MSEHQFPKPKFRRETRLGLVVYGGVSLAVYMNGVCREFYNAVRGRGIYKLIKALTDADIVVDILSGTSAGGINGVLLSYALCNSNQENIVDFANFAEVWRESGDIRQLLYQPLPNNSTESRDSLLDGQGYYQGELQNAFRKASFNQISAPNNEWLSPNNELDLFVTGTDLVGKVYTIFDDTGKLIEVNNHRAVFHLKHRQGRKEPFNPNFNLSGEISTPENTYQALAKLCRITSCFPVAFPVVTVKLNNSPDPADEKLVRWGDLLNRQLPRQEPENGYCLHFVDGGVLDNRPFSYTVQEMYYRVANRPVERKLFYIDPKPDTLLGSPRFNQMSKPDIGQVIQESLVGMPTYESISNDLELIADHNEQVARYNDLFSQIDNPSSKRNFIPSFLNPQEEIYLRSRLIRLRDRVLPLVLRVEQNDSQFSYEYKQNILAKVASLFANNLSGNNQDEPDNFLLSAGQQIRNLDVDYSLRKHQYIVRKIHQLMEDVEEAEEYNQLQELIHNLNRQIKLLEVINASIKDFLNSQIVSNYFYGLIDSSSAHEYVALVGNNLSEGIYNSLIKLHRFLLDADSITENSKENELEKSENNLPSFFTVLPSQAQHIVDQKPEKSESQHQWLPQNLLSDILEKFKQKITQLNELKTDLLKEIIANPKFADNDQENDSTNFSTNLCKVEEASENLIRCCQSSRAEQVLTSFQTFRELDQVLYSFEYITEIGAKELIQTIRISPEDAALGFGANFEAGKRLDGKLAGDSLRSFGGFFKKAWRSNDILWGRLDGLNRLVEGLVTTESCQNFPQFLQRQAKEQGLPQTGEEFEKFQGEYIDFLLQEALPNTQNCEQIRNHLFKLANPDHNLSAAELKTILNDLVLEGHRAILATDLPAVIEDEIAEQLEWNQQKLKPTTTTSKLLDSTPKYYPVSGYFGSMVNSLAAAELAKQALTSLPGNSEEFFRTRYQVGSEKILNDIPSLVLLTLATRSGLVIRDIINTFLGPKRAQIIQKGLIYKVLNNSLRISYWWLQSRGPQTLRAINFAGKPPLIPIIQVALLVVAILGILITVSESLVWVAVVIVSLLLVWLLDSIENQPKK